MFSAELVNTLCLDYLVIGEQIVKVNLLKSPISHRENLTTAE